MEFMFKRVGVVKRIREGMASRGGDQRTTIREYTKRRGAEKLEEKECVENGVC